MQATHDGRYHSPKVSKYAVPGWTRARALYEKVGEYERQLPELERVVWLNPSHAVTIRHLPWLIASGQAPGGQFTYSLGTAPLNPVVVLLSLPAAPVQLPIGVLEIDLLASVLLFSGSQPANGVQSQSLTVPSNPALFGRELAVQAGVFHRATSVLELANSAVVVLY